MVGLFNHFIHHHHAERTSPQWWGCQISLVGLSNHCIHHHHVERTAPPWWGCQISMVGLSNLCIHQQCRKDSHTVRGLNFAKKIAKKFKEKCITRFLKYIKSTPMGIPYILKQHLFSTEVSLLHMEIS